MEERLDNVVPKRQCRNCQILPRFTCFIPSQLPRAILQEKVGLDNSNASIAQAILIHTFDRHRADFWMIFSVASIRYSRCMVKESLHLELTLIFPADNS